MLGGTSKWIIDPATSPIKQLNEWRNSNIDVQNHVQYILKEKKEIADVLAGPSWRRKATKKLLIGEKFTPGKCSQPPTSLHKQSPQYLRISIKEVSDEEEKGTSRLLTKV